MGKTRKDNPYKYGNEGKRLKRIKKKNKKRVNKWDDLGPIKQDVDYYNDTKIFTY